MKFPFKRTSRNKEPVTDLPEDLVTVFCWFCTRECARHPYPVPIHPWETAHNDVVARLDPEKWNLVAYRGYRIAERAVCVGCYRVEMGQPAEEAAEVKVKVEAAP